jgi:hypothetical protein
LIATEPSGQQQPVGRDPVRADVLKMIREERFGDAALGLLPSYNIGNPRVQMFFERLSTTSCATPTPVPWRRHGRTWSGGTASPIAASR